MDISRACLYVSFVDVKSRIRCLPVCIFPLASTAMAIFVAFAVNLLEGTVIFMRLLGLGLDC